MYCRNGLVQLWSNGSITLLYYCYCYSRIFHNNDQYVTRPITDRVRSYENAPTMANLKSTTCDRYCYDAQLTIITSTLVSEIKSY